MSSWLNHLALPNPPRDLPPAEAIVSNRYDPKVKRLERELQETKNQLERRTREVRDWDAMYTRLQTAFNNLHTEATQCNQMYQKLRNDFIDLRAMADRQQQQIRNMAAIDQTRQEQIRAVLNENEALIHSIPNAEPYTPPQ